VQCLPRKSSGCGKARRALSVNTCLPEAATCCARRQRFWSEGGARKRKWLRGGMGTLHHTGSEQLELEVELELELEVGRGASRSSRRSSIGRIIGRVKRVKNVSE
jgi:hypothetical protein